MKIKYKVLTKAERGGKSYKYELTENYSYDINLSHESFTCGKYITYYTYLKSLSTWNGYRWDGSTRVFDTEYCMRAALVHDVLCQLIEEGLLDPSYRKFADKLYRDMIIEDGKEIIEKGPKWLRWPRLKILSGWAGVRYTGLRIYAGWNSIRKRK